MGRKARLKKERRQRERENLNEAWSFFTSRGFLKQVRQMAHDAGISMHDSVACTKIFCELGAHIGLDIRPLSVEVKVFNPIYTALIREHGLDPSEDLMTEYGEKGGRYVILGSKDDRRPRAEDKWPGHLVAFMTAHGKVPAVVDLCVDSAHRPNDDIVITTPLIFGATPTFLSGREVAEGIIPSPKGPICLVYTPLVEDKTFVESQSWSRDYEAKTHDKIEITTPPAPAQPSGLLGPDGFPLRL